MCLFVQRSESLYVQRSESLYAYVKQVLLSDRDRCMCMLNNVCSAIRIAVCSAIGIAVYVCSKNNFPTLAVACIEIQLLTVGTRPRHINNNCDAIR